MSRSTVTMDDTGPFSTPRDQRIHVASPPALERRQPVSHLDQHTDSPVARRLDFSPVVMEPLQMNATDLIQEVTRILPKLQNIIGCENLFGAVEDVFHAIQNPADHGFPIRLWLLRCHAQFNLVDTQVRLLLPANLLDIFEAIENCFGRDA